MSWLARMTVDTQSTYEHGLFDSYAWHQAIWKCFSGEPEKKRDFLTRIEEHSECFTAWVLCRTKPSRPEWCPQDRYELREIAPSFLSHRFYVFDLIANPTRALVCRDENGQPLLKKNGKRRSGKRVPLIHEDDLRSWLERKATSGGFRIDSSKPLEVGKMSESHFSQKNNKAYHGRVQFRGTLEVLDQKQFEHTYYSGIGGAKGFGMGLMLLAPVSHI